MSENTNDTPDEEFSDSDALQNALRAEHAAVYGYGFVGAHREGAERDLSQDHLDAHRTQRDELHSALVRRNATPAASESAYALPDSTDQQALDTFAAQLEERTSHGYLRLAAASDTALRDLAARALQEATIRGLRWGAELIDLPGFPDEEGSSDSEDAAGN